MAWAEVFFFSRGEMRGGRARRAGKVSVTGLRCMWDRARVQGIRVVGNRHDVESKTPPCYHARWCCMICFLISQPETSRLLTRRERIEMEARMRMTDGEGDDSAWEGGQHERAPMHTDPHP